MRVFSGYFLKADAEVLDRIKMINKISLELAIDDFKEAFNPFNLINPI